ncbi:telomere repeats-binding bouquet formation protein 1 isoform X6 [Pseudophryne corroboree]|uniref:telomere repeats-binding bouquet formation protein 1 isoform X6 n=1 Tax=Pseudophryne corroboree TaxID=495146 RepID=UPI00308125C9
MNTTESAQFGGRTASIEMKTDLNLLLECLKFQMDNPDSQKETLVAVRSICQNNSDLCIVTGDASDYFREIGGLIFVNNLAKSSAHTILKEASLYTLGVLAESNVYCQQTLCTLDLFEDVHAVLSNKQFAVNLKRMSVFILLVLVSNNKTGQTLARESRCIDILLILFSKMLTRNMVLPTESTNQQYHLWSSICSALCSCVNNPQNEENQKLCSSAFPQANEWLQHSIQPAITRPICSLIGLTTANNSFAQDYFASVGGLDTLAEVLLQLVKGVQAKRSSIRLAVAVTKTLDACIAENLTAIHHLSEHGVVSSLISLLSCGHLEAEDMFSIVLTVGHCTEDCEPNQYELLKCNGLPLMIQNISNIEEPGRTENISSRYRKAVSAPGRAIVPCFPKNVADHDIAQKSQNNCSNASQCLNRGVSACRESVPLEKVRRQIFPHTATQQNSSASGRTSKSPSHSCITIQEASTDLPCRAQKLNSDSYRNNLSLRDAVTQTVPYDMTKTLPADLHRSQGETLEEAEQTTSTCSITTLRLNAAKQSTANNAGINIDPLTLCADIIDKEISGILGTRVLLTELRCSGCLATDFVMNSRNCSKILQECSHLCDRHRIILQAEERYKTEFKKVMRGTGCSIAHKQLTPIRRAGAVLQNESNSSRILLTPIRKVINEDKHHKKAVCFLHKPPPQ